VSAARKRVAVVGGGLAGLTAALDCADAGDDVTLLEARPRLGGLTASFRRSVEGGSLWVDTGQHVFLRCCTAYLGLLERLDVRDQVALQPRLDVPVRSGRQPGTGRLRRDPLPAPLHLGRALLGYGWLPLADRLRVMTAALALAATVFQLGLLDGADAADIGWARVPLQRLHGDAGAAALTAAGVEVRLRTRVRALDRTGAGWTVVTDDGGASYDHVVLALPPGATDGLLPPGAVDLPAGWAARLGSSPIVNVHLVFDRPLLDVPFVAAVDSPLQWAFDRSGQSGLPAGTYVALSLSAADDLVDRPVADLRSWVLPHLHRLLPASRAADLKEFFVTREPAATFRPAPGSRRLRPGPTTALPGLHLAGAWTDTGWPATMEGAVRSGHAAGASVRADAVRPVAVSA
jgi:uncharacterized protein with NAD-binding domain and iron-sulfur cluster